MRLHRKKTVLGFFWMWLLAPGNRDGPRLEIAARSDTDIKSALTAHEWPSSFDRLRQPVTLNRRLLASLVQESEKHLPIVARALEIGIAQRRRHERMDERLPSLLTLEPTIFLRADDHDLLLAANRHALRAIAMHALSPPHQAVRIPRQR